MIPTSDLFANATDEPYDVPKPLTRSIPLSIRLKTTHSVNPTLHQTLEMPISVTAWYAEAVSPSCTH